MAGRQALERHTDLAVSVLSTYVTKRDQRDALQRTGTLMVPRVWSYA
jgi:hypothetical protein